MSTRKPAEISHATAEYLFGALMLAFGVIVMYGSYIEDIDWHPGGPGPGYFPFRIGAIIAAASLGVIVQTFWKRADLKHSFAGEGGLGRVAAIFVPTAVCALAIPYLGIYVPSVLFIFYFLVRHGSVPLWRAALVSIAIVASFYLVFEYWLDVVMPKGPVEALFLSLI
jgi:putative tricarboxylic transport membrane protein